MEKINYNAINEVILSNNYLPVSVKQLLDTIKLIESDDLDAIKKEIYTKEFHLSDKLYELGEIYPDIYCKDNLKSILLNNLCPTTVIDIISQYDASVADIDDMYIPRRLPHYGYYGTLSFNFSVRDISTSKKLKDLPEVVSIVLNSKLSSYYNKFIHIVEEQELTSTDIELNLSQVFTQLMKANFDYKIYSDELATKFLYDIIMNQYIHDHYVSKKYNDRLFEYESKMINLVSINNTQELLGFKRVTSNFKSGITDSNYEFKVGSKFTEKNPEICNHGFHFSSDILNTSIYKNVDRCNMVLLVKGTGEFSIKSQMLEDAYTNEGPLSDKICFETLETMKILNTDEIIENIIVEIKTFANEGCKNIMDRYINTIKHVILTVSHERQLQLLEVFFDQQEYEDKYRFLDSCLAISVKTNNHTGYRSLLDVADILNYKNEVFNICNIINSGVFHIDHLKYTMDVIISKYLDLNKLDIASMKTILDKCHVDEEFANDWYNNKLNNIITTVLIPTSISEKINEEDILNYIIQNILNLSGDYKNDDQLELLIRLLDYDDDVHSFLTCDMTYDYLKDTHPKLIKDIDVYIKSKLSMDEERCRFLYTVGSYIDLSRGDHSYLFSE